jgi:DNA-binding response OmpR family regulator
VAKILVIDDDPMNTELLTVRLERAGHDVRTADTGERGLAAAGADVDLVILDVMMPKMDGWQVCRLLRAGARTKSLPIIMLSACIKEIEQLRGFESGATDYVAKPWDPAALLSLVEKHLAANAAGGPK